MLAGFLDVGVLWQPPEIPSGKGSSTSLEGMMLVCDA